MRVLLIEDDEYIANFLETVLTKENYAVDVATDGELGWRLIETFTYDLILLDVILPKLDGITLCRQIREHHYQTPILLLTARDSSSDRVSGLDAGADDYMVKPFELPELFARMRVLLRRSSSPVVSVLAWEQLQLDPTACQVTYADRPLHLTPKEYRLLELFLRNPRYVFTRSRILEHLWGAEEAPGENTITAHIKGLRQKLKLAGAPTGFIETVYGIGYRLKQSSNGKAASDAAEPTSPPLLDRPIAASSAPASPLHPLGYPQSTRAELEQSWHKQQLRTALQTVWQKYEPQNRDRLQVLEQTIAAMQTDDMWDEVWQQAQFAAHKLAGVLGLFERSQGSQLALQLEQFFSTKQMPDPQELESLIELIHALKAVLSEAPPKDTPLSSVSPALPETALTRASLLLILDDAAEQASQIVRATQRAIVPLPSLSSAYRALAEGIQHRPSKRMPPQHYSASPVQRFILNLSLADLTESDLALLQGITHQVPPAVTLVFTDQADLALRAKLAQIGVDAVLPQLPLEQVVSLVEQLQSPIEAPKQILIVNDDPQLLAAMRAILEPWGLHLIALERPSQLWETLQTHAPDLLILDVEMPDLNGIELCQAVRNVPGWKHLPIWFLTAHTDANILYQVINAGANALLRKPIRELEIIRRILGEFRRSQLSQAFLS